MNATNSASATAGKSSVRTHFEGVGFALSVLQENGWGRARASKRLHNGLITIRHTIPLQKGNRIEDLAPSVPPRCTANGGGPHQARYDRYHGRLRVAVPASTV